MCKYLKEKIKGHKFIQKCKWAFAASLCAGFRWPCLSQKSSSLCPYKCQSFPHPVCPPWSWSPGRISLSKTCPGSLWWARTLFQGPFVWGHALMEEVRGEKEELLNLRMKWKSSTAIRRAQRGKMKTQDELQWHQDYNSASQKASSTMHLICLCQKLNCWTSLFL